MLGAKGPNATCAAKVSDETDLTDSMYKVQGVVRSTGLQSYHVCGFGQVT